MTRFIEDNPGDFMTVTGGDDVDYEAAGAKAKKDNQPRKVPDSVPADCKDDWLAGYDGK